MNRILLRSNTFVRATKKQVKNNRSAADDIKAALNLLTTNAFHPKLKTHKLKGNLEGYLACSAGYDLRIIFRFVAWEGKEAILLETIGTHDEVY